MNQPLNEIPIACVREAGDLTPEARKRGEEIWETIASRALGIEELETGYAIRFKLNDGLFLDLAELITYERHCCPFLEFALELKPDSEEMSLRLNGSKEAKEFLSMELAALKKINRS